MTPGVSGHDLPSTLRVKARKLSRRDVEGLAGVQVWAKAGEWLLYLPEQDDYRLVSDKVFRRDFKRGRK